MQVAAGLYSSGAVAVCVELALLASPTAAPIDAPRKVLPSDFTRTNCTANAHDEGTTAFASVGCSHCNIVGGRPSGRFYPQEIADALQSQFHGDLKMLSMSVTRCPEGAPATAPGPWQLAKANGEGSTLVGGIYTHHDKSTDLILICTSAARFVLGRDIGGIVRPVAINADMTAHSSELRC